MASPLHVPSSSSVSSSSAPSSAPSSKPPKLSAEHPLPVTPSLAPSQTSNPPAGTLIRPAFQSRPSTVLPELPYDTSHHKASITIIWTLLAFDAFVMPLALFYALWYGTHPRLDPAYLFAITTGVFGLISGAEWAYRGWSLWRRPELRPLGLNHDRHADDVRLEGRGPGAGHEDEATQQSEGVIPTNNNGRQARIKKRWYDGWYYKLDFFHFSYTIGYSIGLIELIIGSSPSQPFLRLCATPTATFIILYGLLFCIFAFYYHTSRPPPFRISSQPGPVDLKPPSASLPAAQPVSLPRGPLRPLTYTILEDVLSVDTGLGACWRNAMDARYTASPPFRRLLAQMDLFWGVPAILTGVGTLVVVGLEAVPQEVAYGIGWGVPPVWAILWAALTYFWVKRSLRRERQAWNVSATRTEGEKEQGGQGG